MKVAWALLLLAAAPALASSTVSNLADAYVDLQLRADPTQAILSGLDDPAPDQLPNHSPGAIARLARAEDELAEALARIPGKAIGAEHRLYSVLAEELTASRQMRICHTERWSVSHIAGWQLVLPQVAAAQELSRPAARAAWLARWRDLPRFVDQEIANARAGLDSGYSVPQPVVARVIAQLDSVASSVPENSPFAAALPEADSVFRAQALALVRDTVTPAVRRYRNFLKYEYLPLARKSLGLSVLPDGAACYRALLRHYTTLNRAPREIYRLGQLTVADNRKRVGELGRDLVSAGDFATVVALIAKSSDNRFESREAALAFDAAALARSLKGSSGAFEHLPGQAVELRPMSDAYARAGSPAHYVPNPDPQQSAAYAVPLATWASWTRGEAEIAVFHETVPGHHLQVALSRESGGGSRLMKLADNAAYVEGWARYAEGLSEELGLYSTPYARITRRVWPGRGMVLDPGLHLYGWTREQARAYLKETGRFDDATIEAVIDRVAALPGQLTAYDTGALEIVSLRREAEVRLGSRFSLEGFHTAVLEEGIVPLGELRRHVHAWLAEH